MIKIGLSMKIYWKILKKLVKNAIFFDNKYPIKFRKLDEKIDNIIYDYIFEIR